MPNGRRFMGLNGPRETRYLRLGSMNQETNWFEGSPCKKCGELRYYRNGKACVSCQKNQARDWQRQNPNLLRGHNISTKLNRRYGITSAARDKMLTDQNSQCAICAKPLLGWGGR